MTFRELDYQAKVFKAVEDWLDVLCAERAKLVGIEKLRLEHPDLDIPMKDYAAETWAKLRADNVLPKSRDELAYSKREDGIGRPVPNATIKVPTGGGKTFLAVSALSRILGRLENRNTGFVLWIVPNDAIYKQTLKHLSDRQHVYRQVLERASAGRVKIYEKNDSLNKRDVDLHLCVMLLMLQSANKENKDSLHIFRDRGDVHGFFPDESDGPAHAALLKEIPNLRGYKDEDSQIEAWPQVKESLGNALCLMRPIVVIDEGHKTMSELAYRTLYGFNPKLVLELTATPKDNPKTGRHANILVEVTGVELDREGMIKMPLNLDAQPGTDWKVTLDVAIDRANALQTYASQLAAERYRFIRPIMLVQVERTGKDQREGGFIHAEDVKDRLLALGFAADEIAIKSAEQDDLEGEDLLSPTNRIRFIITKQALQEGWDCPFAYVLCALAAQSNEAAMTQLVGRILRQPHAEKIGNSPLDECYVVTHHAQTGSAIAAIKKGLEGVGLGDLTLNISEAQGEATPAVVRKVQRRKGFETSQIYLPKVVHSEDGVVRDLDYETDILSRLDWNNFDGAAIAKRVPENAAAAERTVQVIAMEDSEEHFATRREDTDSDSYAFDPAYATRRIGDIVQNPFVARAVIGGLLDALRKRGHDDEWLGKRASFILTEARKTLESSRDEMAEAVFREGVEHGRIQFSLRTDGNNWQMPFEIETQHAEKAKKLRGDDDEPVKNSLFAPVFDEDYNGPERGVAVQLDGAAALKWWHRNVARSQYSIQGWKRGKIYPDFIFAVNRKGASAKIVVLEAKGEHLSGNPDTVYKTKVLDYMTENFRENAISAGSLKLEGSNEIVECKLILMANMKSELPKVFQ